MPNEIFTGIVGQPRFTNVFHVEHVAGYLLTLVLVIAYLVAHLHLFIMTFSLCTCCFRENESVYTHEYGIRDSMARYYRAVEFAFLITLRNAIFLVQLGCCLSRARARTRTNAPLFISPFSYCIYSSYILCPGFTCIFLLRDAILSRFCIRQHPACI